MRLIFRLLDHNGDLMEAHRLVTSYGPMAKWLEPESENVWRLRYWLHRARGMWVYAVLRADMLVLRPTLQGLAILDWGHVSAPEDLPLAHFWCRPGTPKKAVVRCIGEFYGHQIAAGHSFQVNPGPGSFAWRVTERLGGQPTADGRGLILSPERFNHGWWRRIQTQAPEARAEAGAGDHGGG